MFWLMELDLISLKGNSVSSGRFWGVYGFSMSYGSPSGFDSVRHIYFCSCFKVALSAYLHCCQPPSCPWNYCQCFCSQVPPCTAGLSLLVRGLYGSFLSSLTMPSVSPESCVGFPQPPERPSVLRGLCALVFTLQALPLCHRACVHLSWLMGPALCVEGFVCTCFDLPAHPLCHRACVSFFWLPRPTFSAARVVCTGEVCMPLHSQDPGPALCAVGLLWASLFSPSLPSGHGHSP